MNSEGSPRGDFVAGIDVGAAAKGYHGAVLLLGSDSVYSLFHFKSPEETVRHLARLEENLGGRLRALGIDSPPRASRKRKEARAAERELVRFGHRVLWTPGPGRPTSGWMRNGEKLWRALGRAFPRTLLMEVFPTASADASHADDFFLPFHLLAGKSERKYSQDYLDACLAARTASRALDGEARVFGETDELGPIRVLHEPRKLYTLCFPAVRNRVLLGYKKRGFGRGLWNGFGGKVHPGESPEEGARRELEEESGLTGGDFEEGALLHFSFAGEKELMECRVFRARKTRGTPRETGEMKPRWFNRKEIPYEKMWAGDRLWLPEFLNGTRLRAHLRFNQKLELEGFRLITE